MAQKETTTSYRWSDDSIIRRIDVRTQSDGRSVAYLYANPDPAKHDVRMNIRAAIRLKGWGTLSDHRDNVFGLRVAGMHGNGQDLIEMLQQEGFVGAPAQVMSADSSEPEQKQGFMESIRANSLKYSGILATVGNGLSIASGFARGREIGQIGQGAAFAVADLPLALAGERDDARQLNNLLLGLKTHYEKDGIEIPRTASIYVETSNAGKTLGERTKDLLHRYANQIKCSMEIVAAGFTIYAGRKQDSSFKKYAPFFWGPGFAASLLIPERKIDPEKYEKANGLERFWMKVQSNPLSVGGLLGYTNTVASYGSAITERKRELVKRDASLPFTQHYRWDFAIPSVMIGANGLYAVSKKTVGGSINNNDIENDAYTVAAQIINKQPEATRQHAIESTARFFAERTEIKDAYPEIMARLVKEVNVQRQNPWFEPLGLAAKPAAARPSRSEADSQPQSAAADAVPATAASTVNAATVENIGKGLGQPQEAARGA